MVKDMDYTKKENQTFKNWFLFCVSNWWLQITLVGLILTILELFYIKTVMIWIRDAFSQGTFTGIFTCIFLPLPLAIFGITVYKGCIQHWLDTCRGTSR